VKKPGKLQDNLSKAASEKRFPYKSFVIFAIPAGNNNHEHNSYKEYCFYVQNQYVRFSYGVSFRPACRRNVGLMPTRRPKAERRCTVRLPCQEFKP
jgi:hypothetical protein